VTSAELPAEQQPDAVTTESDCLAEPTWLQGRRRGAQFVVDAEGRLVSAVVRTVVGFVDDHRARFRTGPTWAELRRHMGWNRHEAAGAISQLRRHRILHTTRKSRSLKVHYQARHVLKTLS